MPMKSTTVSESVEGDAQHFATEALLAAVGSLDGYVDSFSRICMSVFLR